MRTLDAIAVAAALTLAGCTFLLDPENCASDGDCNGGVCQDGICVGPVKGEDPEDVGTDGDMDDTPDPDAGDAAIQDDMGDMSTPPDPDMMLEPDGPPAPKAPICEIRAPDVDARFISALEASVELVVFDGDNALDELTVTLNGEAVPLDENGNAVVSVTLSEGTNPIVLEATDPDGLSCPPQRISIMVDTTPPTLDLEQPGGPNTLTRRSTFTFVGSVADAHPTQILMVSLNGADLADLDVDWRGTDFEFDVELESGDNTVTLVAEDEIGLLSEQVEVTLTLDDNPPEVEISAPADGLETGAEAIDVTGQVEVDDPFFRSQVVLTVVSDDGRTVIRDSAPGGRVAVEDVPLALGANEIEVCGDDAAGNMGCATVTVTRISQNPCVTIETPEARTFTSGAAVDVTGTACPVVTQVMLQAGDAEPVAAMLAGGQFSGRVILPRPGNITVTAIASTENGSTAEDERVVVFDDSPPAVRITTPSANECRNDPELQVCGTTSDNQSGVVRLVANVADAVQTFDNPPRQFCYNLAMPQNAEDLEIRLTAENGAGLTADTSVIVDIDRDPPILDFDLPFDGPDPVFVRANRAGRFMFTGQIRAVGDICPVLRLTSNGSPQLIEPGGAFSIRGIAEDGPTALEIAVEDTAGNADEQVVAFQVDSAEPTLEDVRPASPLVTSEQIIDISARTCDGGSGLNPDRAFIDGVAVNPQDDARQNCQTITRTVGVPEGVTEFTIEVEDQVGNRNSETIIVSRDVTAPELDVTYPAPNDSVESVLIVEGTVDDGDLGSGVNRVEANGVEAQIDGFTGEWRAVNVPVDAEGNITVVAFDNGNNRTEPIVIPVLINEYVLTDRDRIGFAGADSTGWVGLMDINGDNRLDIVALTSALQGDSGAFTQNEDRTFDAHGVGATGLPEGEITDAAVGDFNADGKPDIFVVGNNINGVWLGDVDVAFNRVQIATLIGVSATGVAVGDLNRDRALDALVFAGNSTRILFGNGEGGFDRDDLGAKGLADATNYTDGEFLDVNGDGILDLVAYGPAGTEMWIGDRLGTFTSPGAAVPPVAAIPDTAATFATLVDANRDGILDLYMAAAGAGRIVVGDGDTLPTEQARGLDLAAGERKAVVADYDGDARDDVIVYGPEGFKVYRNDPANAFVRANEGDLGLPVLRDITAAAIGDIDGDGDFDIVGADANGPFLIRSNADSRRIGYRYVYLDIRRGLPASDGPRDAVGIQILQNLAGDDSPERTLAPNPVGPTVVTLGGAQSGNFAIRYLDLGAPGSNLRDIAGVESAATETVFPRE